MIEILLVIGVIAILTAIVLVGMRSITSRAREQQTKQLMQNLRNMLAEFENSTRLSKGPAAWGWFDGSGRIMVTVGMNLYTIPPGTQVVADFWRVPYKSSQEAPPMPGDSPAPLDGPGFIGTTTGGVEDRTNLARNGSRQILNTQLAMNFVLSVPSNRSGLQGISSDRLFTPYWVAGRIPSPGGDGVLQTQDDNPTGEDVFYYEGNRVSSNGKFWRCKVKHVPAAAPTEGGQWAEEGGLNDKSAPTPIFLDAWNNPIIFVPATGLRVRKLNGQSALDPTRRGQTFVIVSPEGSATAPNFEGDVHGKLVRAGKPFFASAGPDGDFSTGEDNIYSFEE